MRVEKDLENVLAARIKLPANSQQKKIYIKTDIRTIPLVRNISINRKKGKGTLEILKARQYTYYDNSE